MDLHRLSAALTTTLTSLLHLRLQSSSILVEPQSEVIVGGFGDVERGQLLKEDGIRPTIAVKKLRPQGDRSQRIRVVVALARELQVWADLDHENILKLIGFYIDEDMLNAAWIITIWQPHGNVTAYIAATSPGLVRRLELALDTAKGLAYLHSLDKPVCHGDIKPANTLVGNNGKAMICDFGLARILEDVPSGLTTSNLQAGTSRYASPELFTEIGAVHTTASDVWAWGCLFLGIVTDTIPYRKERLEYTIISSIIQGKPPADISELHTPELVAMILRGCWAAAPMARPTMPWCENVLIQEVGQHTLLKERHGAKADDSTEMSFLTTSEVSGSHHQLPDKSATDLTMDTIISIEVHGLLSNAPQDGDTDAPVTMSRLINAPRDNSPPDQSYEAFTQADIPQPVQVRGNVRLAIKIGPLIGGHSSGKVYAVDVIDPQSAITLPHEGFVAKVFGPTKSDRSSHEAFVYEWLFGKPAPVMQYFGRFGAAVEINHALGGVFQEAGTSQVAGNAGVTLILLERGGVAIKPTGEGFSQGSNTVEKIGTTLACYQQLLKAGVGMNPRLQHFLRPRKHPMCKKGARLVDFSDARKLRSGKRVDDELYVLHDNWKSQTTEEEQRERDARAEAATMLPPRKKRTPKAKMNEVGGPYT